MPISCHFGCCKALLLLSQTYVSSAVASVQTFNLLPLTCRVDLNYNMHETRHHSRTDWSYIHVARCRRRSGSVVKHPAGSVSTQCRYAKSQWQAYLIGERRTFHLRPFRRRQLLSRFSSISYQPRQLGRALPAIIEIYGPAPKSPERRL